MERKQHVWEQTWISECDLGPACWLLPQDPCTPPIFSRQRCALLGRGFCVLSPSLTSFIFQVFPAWVGLLHSLCLFSSSVLKVSGSQGMTPFSPCSCGPVPLGKPPVQETCRKQPFPYFLSLPQTVVYVIYIWEVGASLNLCSSCA